MKTPCPVGQGVNDKSLPACRRQALIKVSILKATNRESACSIAGAHVGSAAIEVEAASIRAANCTAPIAAEGTDIEERTIVAAEARHGQFKR